ncbi:MAG: hypothetical protein IT161_22680 [Bryobacterales bacterium]|nr:hypothetical protein [Bryobacterales bacterium]
MIQSLFYEQLAEFIEDRLAEFNPRAHVLPIPDHDEHEVDYQFDAGPRPLYLFGVKRSHPHHERGRQAVPVAG